MTLAALLLIPILLGVSDPRPTLLPAPEIAKPDPSWKGSKDAAWLDREHRMTLQEVEKLLREIRPVYPESNRRKMAMMAVDETMHYKDPNAGDSPAVKSYYKARMDAAVYDIEKTKIKTGAVIWKLYNHAFVVKTPSVAIAFDMTRGHWIDNGKSEVDDQIKRIIDQCDALFISHNHGDHLDDFVRDTFLAQGKPIIAPAEVYEGDNRITRLTRDGVTKQKVQLKNGRELEVIVFPGFQGTTVCNVPLVFTPEGMSFAHTGDIDPKSGTPEFETIGQWLDKVKDWKPDVLMVNVWATDLMRIVRAFDPKLVITGHENELGHDPIQRKPHCQAYERLEGWDKPWITMEWGESYYYQPVVDSK